MADQSGAAESHDQPNEDAARAEALNAPMRRLRAGEITARQADAAWEAADVLPYAMALPGGVPDLFWPLPLAVAWIATRRLDLVEREALRAQFHGERVAREPAEAGWVTDFATARERLQVALMDGDIEGSGRDKGPVGRRVTIAAVEWQDLTVCFVEGSGAVSRGFAGIAPPAWCEITVRRSDVLRLWPTIDAEAGVFASALPLDLTPSPTGGDLDPAASPSAASQGSSSAAPSLATLARLPEVTAAPVSRADHKAAKALAIERAKDITAGAPGGMLVPALWDYVREREPQLSRADFDGLKRLYPDLRKPGENARTLASRKSPK